MIKVILSVLIAVAAVSCDIQKEEYNTQRVEENLVRATAPDATETVEVGYLLPGLDHGFIQSPINILTCETVKKDKHSLNLHYKKSNEKVSNLGHTIQVNYTTGSTVEFDGLSYDFVQFHFHTPSEHLIDGVTYPMEMHMVHKRKVPGYPDSVSYLVIGVWFKEGRENNPFLDEFLGAIPEEDGAVKEVKGGVVNINDLLEQPGERKYYHYHGSLTTPPYSESVSWLLLSHIFNASPSQIEKINRLEGNNARHIQAKYSREVEMVE